jgi:hypothetical protein
MPSDITIVKQDEEVKFDDAGKIVEQVRISFKVGNDGPFIRRFPKDTFNAVDARNQLEAFARELRQMRSQS